MDRPTEPSDSAPPAPHPRDYAVAFIHFLLAAPFLFAFVLTVRNATSFVAWSSLICPAIFGVVSGAIGLLLAWHGRRVLTRRRDRWRASRRGRRTLCFYCGYDLRGGQEFCPECGRMLPESYEAMAERLQIVTRESEKKRAVARAVLGEMRLETDRPQDANDRAGRDGCR